jgi:hypothetical protein
MGFFFLSERPSSHLSSVADVNSTSSGNNFPSPACGGELAVLAGLACSGGSLSVASGFFLSQCREPRPRFHVGRSYLDHSFFNPVAKIIRISK